MQDLLGLEQSYSTSSRDWYQRVKDLLSKTIQPEINQAYIDGRFPRKWIQQLASLNILGMTLPEAFGGQAASALDYGLVCQALEECDSGLRSFLSVQSALVMFPIFKYGSDAQRQQYLPTLASGDLIGCFGLTEPEFGSDPAHMQTTAKKVGDDWVLTGKKTWITNATIADIAIVWAKTDEGIQGFIVPTDTPGCTTEQIRHKLSLRASDTGSLIFENCKISDAQRLPEMTQGLSGALSCLTQARYGVAWGAQGAAISCYQTALEYAKTRKQFGKPIASFQLVQLKLVEMVKEIVKMQAVSLQLARQKDAGELHPVAVSLAKMNACDAALTIARNARDVMGANGILIEYAIMRHAANLESVITYEGSDNIHHLIIGKHITGLSAF